MKHIYKSVLKILLVALVLPTNVYAAELTNFESNWGDFFVVQGSSLKSFTRRSGTTSSSNTGPSGGAEGTAYYVYLETSSGSAYYNGDMAMLESQTTTATTLSFYYHMYGIEMGTLAVAVWDGSSWQEIWSISGQRHTSINDAWTRKALDISAFPTDKKVRFIATAAGGYRGDMAIDQIRLDSAAVVVRYTYDALGRLTFLTDNINGNKDYDMDAAGNRIRVQNGVDDDASNDDDFGDTGGSEPICYAYWSYMGTTITYECTEASKPWDSQKTFYCNMQCGN
ncbi:hypothetical protein [Catenovulum sediminis]|uniref:MAM domain-containing protein n=1 Tax=Catenovulum sediminis TaxID=1740262 RepID=A0ABV1RF89_9ALTE|nr:hypothetical protein [Catenovulum sediminis]